ncbi:MAG: hypothetical protein ACI9AX_000742 [Polaromonas sp.]
MEAVPKTRVFGTVPPSIIVVDLPVDGASKIVPTLENLPKDIH